MNIQIVWARTGWLIGVTVTEPGLVPSFQLMTLWSVTDPSGTRKGSDNSVGTK